MAKDNSPAEAEPVVGKEKSRTYGSPTSTVEKMKWSEWASILGVPVALYRGAIAHAKADIEEPVTRDQFEKTVRAFAGKKCL